MPHLETEPLILRYYASIKDKYPQITSEHFMSICKAPFYFIKSQMERPDMPRIFIKFFGKFSVTSANIKEKLNKLEKSYNNKKYNILTPEEYAERKAFFTAKYTQLKAEEEEADRLDMRSAKNRREQGEQELEIIDDTDN